MKTKAPVVYVLTAFFGLQMLLAGTSFAFGVPFLTYQPPYWRTLLIYVGVAAYLGTLSWRQSPRTRFAVYVFLSVDMLRGARGAHWGTIAVDVALLGLMQLASFRAVYPTLHPGAWPRRRRSATAVTEAPAFKVEDGAAARRGSGTAEQG